jgi:serine protease Do
MPILKIKIPEPDLSKVTKKIKKVKINRKVLGFLGMSFLSGILGGIIVLALIAIPNSPLAKFISKNSGPLIQENQTLTVTESSAEIDAAKKIAPSVVSIETSGTTTNIFGQSVTQQGGGSGLIVSSDGLILTNKHVASDSNTQYTVILTNGSSYTGTLKSTDALNDLAVLKIDASGLQAAELGDSDQLQIGQRVIAVGFALGEFKNTVTSGIISGKDRTLDAQSEQLQGMLQTDAAINPGNSGGPLVNLAGQVIGIDTAIASSAQNIGFAIPINMAKKAISDVKQFGHIRSPYLGIHYVTNSSELAKANNLAVDYGVLIYSNDPSVLAVVPGSPSGKVGLKEGDIVTYINQDKIDTDHSLDSILQKYSPGDKVTITYFRDGKENKVSLTLGESQ